MSQTVIAVDIAKKVFQLHWVDQETGVMERLKLKRSQMLPWFANREPFRVIMEACGGAHEWARQLVQSGHDVRLLAPKTVRPFVQRNKTDAAGAHDIWTAGQQPGAVFVAVKNEAQQVVLSLHRLRARLMKMRIMQTNELRGLLYEFGVVLPEGHHRALLQELPDAQQRLPAMLIDSLDEQVKRINGLEADIAKIERRLSQQLRQTAASKALSAIPGVGLLTAKASRLRSLHHRPNVRLQPHVSAAPSTPVAKRTRHATRRESPHVHQQRVAPDTASRLGHAQPVLVITARA